MLLLFWQSAKNCQNDGTLKFFLTHDHMELEISKRYFSNSFFRIPSKLYEDIAYDRRVQAVTLLTCELMGKPKMLNIPKRVIIEQNGCKFGSRGTTVHIQWVLFMPESLSLVWVIWSMLANFQFYNF